jgi:ribosomal protein S6
MSNTKQNNYKTTFILDLRKSEDDASKVIADISEVLGQIGAVVSESRDLGVRDFARAADRRFTQGHYIEIRYAGASTTPVLLKEKLRLDKRVNRICIEAV